MNENLLVYHSGEMQVFEEKLLRSKLDQRIEIKIGANKLNKIFPYEILIEGKPDKGLLESSENLRILIIPYAGLPTQTRDLLLGYPHIRVHNLHYNSIATAEHAVALLLAACKYLIPYDQNLRKNDWRSRYSPNPALVLNGKTVLILGFGHIGQHIAKILQCFGMRIIVIRNDSNKNLAPTINAQIFSIDKLSYSLAHADVFIIALPLTPSTRFLINKTNIHYLQKHTVLVNIGRGEIIDQSALYLALKNRDIAAAGIDVWYSYPSCKSSRENTPPSDYPFSELENVVMSPHRAGGLNAKEIEELRILHLAAMLNAAANGEPLPNQIDVQQGY